MHASTFILLLTEILSKIVSDIRFNPLVQCTSAIAQLSKGRNKEDKESPELQSLATTTLEKDYKQRASDKLGLLTSALKSLKIS